MRVKSPGVDRGSTFTVDLPLAPLQHEPTEDRRHPSSPPTASPERIQPSLNGVSVLVVEDEDDSRELVALFLSKAGATVETANSGAEGLEKIKAGQFDVLVSDIGMPQMDGYQFIEAVRSLDPQHSSIPAIALTAYARTEDRVAAIAKGFQMHISKPADALELTTMIRSLARK